MLRWATYRFDPYDRHNLLNDVRHRAAFLRQLSILYWSVGDAKLRFCRCTVGVSAEAERRRDEFRRRHLPAGPAVHYCLPESQQRSSLRPPSSVVSPGLAHPRQRRNRNRKQISA